MKPAICTAQALGAACVRKAPALVRCWCRELSVLDCEVGGERWVWSVPARPANDTAPNEGSSSVAGKSHNAPGYGRGPHPGLSVRAETVVPGHSSPKLAASIASSGGNCGIRPQLNRRKRQPRVKADISTPKARRMQQTGGGGSLTDWLREEGSVPNTELAENGSQRGEHAGTEVTP